MLVSKFIIVVILVEECAMKRNAFPVCIAVLGLWQI